MAHKCLGRQLQQTVAGYCWPIACLLACLSMPFVNLLTLLGNFSFRFVRIFVQFVFKFSSFLISFFVLFALLSTCCTLLPHRLVGHEPAFAFCFNCERKWRTTMWNQILCLTWPVLLCTRTRHDFVRFCISSA